jgi:hypothetical protein
LEPIFDEPTPVEPDRRPVASRAGIGRRGVAIAGIVGAVLLGAVVAAASLGGQDTVLAASTASPSPSAATAPGTGTNPADCGPGGGLGPDHEAVSDTSVAATAIGISESDLAAALRQGQTIAQVAKAHGVDVQKAIDALVADANDEIATALKNGAITQAQADAENAQVTQRVTAQVNGTFQGGPGGYGPGGHGRPNDNDADDGGSSASPTATPSA